MPYKFDKFDVSSQVFYNTKSTFAFVNLRPILPGHVLISPIKVVKKLEDLNAKELCDFSLTVQYISKIIKSKYGADSLNIAIQDGLLAGQSVEHLHCHIIPRKKDDFPDIDDVYRHLDNCDYLNAYTKMRSLIAEKKGGVDYNERSDRSMPEMETEARELNAFIKNSDIK